MTANTLAEVALRMPWHLETLREPDRDPRPVYRACALGRDGRPSSSVAVEAEDDAEAVRLTRVLGAFYPVELWDQSRFLARFGPGDTVCWGEVDRIAAAAGPAH